MTANIVKDRAFAATGAAFMARIRGSDGSYVTQAATTSIAYAVSDVTTGASVSVITGSPVVSSTVFDTLQTDAAWSKDSTGYNFKHSLAATAFPTIGHVYLVVYTFTPAAGDVYKAEYQVTAL